MKRVRKPDDPEKRKQWESSKTLKTDLQESKERKKRARVHHVGCIERGRRAQLADEKATEPVYRALLVNPWTPAIRPSLEALAQQCLKKKEV